MCCQQELQADFLIHQHKGIKSQEDFSLGLSPAANLKEHKDLYLLPTDYSDIIIYTGFGFPLRDILLTKALML